MTVVPDHELRALGAVQDARPGALQPASVDLHLGDLLLAWPIYITRDPRYDQAHAWKAVPLQETDGIGAAWLLVPGIRYLAATTERVAIPPDCAGELSGRSSWGRDGLEVHRTAGWIDPGFEGNPTLELSVVGSSLVLWPGASVCQLILHRLSSPCERPYLGRYRFDTLPTPTRMATTR